ncbi:hypothetical protein HDU99_010583 [Rhizoclosmatium hyalinum]|nr:hypothetical protein HDU99_010583 [Rhizoclosmatium hyalinum]
MEIAQVGLVTAVNSVNANENGEFVNTINGIVTTISAMTVSFDLFVLGVFVGYLVFIKRESSHMKNQAEGGKLNTEKERVLAWYGAIACLLLFGMEASTTSLTYVSGTKDPTVSVAVWVLLITGQEISPMLYITVQLLLKGDILWRKRIQSLGKHAQLRKQSQDKWESTLKNPSRKSNKSTQ